MKGCVALLSLTLFAASLELGAGAANFAQPLSLFPINTEDEQLPRIGRTLVNTFPFNQKSGEDHAHDHAHEHEHAHHDEDHAHHAHHDEHHEHHEHPAHAKAEEEVPARNSRQGASDGLPEQENAIDIGEVAQAGERCVEKVMMIEETQYDEQIECHHSYDKRCHTTYTTDYEPQQEEDCDENFVKNCYIEYKQVAFDEDVRVCNEKLVRNCDKPGPEVCETVYESECETSYHEHEVEEDQPACRIMQVEKCRDVTQGYTTEQQCDVWPKQVCELETKVVKKYTPETQCKKIPRQVCGPGPCPIEQGPEECRDEKKTIVQEVPEEACDLNPQKVCKFITKLVPVLKPKENCVDIPKEVCTRSRRNPRKVKRPVIKKWCYIPTEESGLAGDAPTNTPSDEQSTSGSSTRRRN